MRLGNTNTNSSPTDSLGGAVIDVLDPFSSDKNTTFRALSGKTVTGAGGVILGSGSLANTDPVTSITLLSGTGASFLAKTRFSLYGLRS
jgi:hypothetical protein